MKNPSPGRRDQFSREELEQFIREKEQIRHIVGQIGGKPTPASKIGNIAMMSAIILTFIGAFFLPEYAHLPAIEIGLVLLSIKIFMFLHNEAKVIHFQFWMLSSLEWRLNDMSKRISSIDDNLQSIANDAD
ncbi:hypothetical protein JXO52_07990 [bacterium]|nr:hypothetical protein [bacterium]